MSSLQSRIKPLPMSQLRPEWNATLDRIPGDGLKGPGFPKNVLGTIMHNQETFGPFLDFWVTSKLQMSLSVREQELVILRMGLLFQCEYVWKHHVPVAREFGVTDRELNGVRSSEIPNLFSAKELALLTLTDEMVNQRTIRESAWKIFAKELSEKEIVDLISLVSQYVFFALMNNAMKVEVEDTLQNVPGLTEVI